MPPFHHSEVLTKLTSAKTHLLFNSRNFHDHGTCTGSLRLPYFSSTMLTVQQLYFPLVTFQFFTKIGLLPLIIDVRNGRIMKQTSKKLWSCWSFLMVLTASHGFYAIAQLIKCFFSADSRVIEDLPMVVNLLVWMTSFYLFLLAFVWNGDVTLTTFNALFQGRWELQS